MMNKKRIELRKRKFARMQQVKELRATGLSLAKIAMKLKVSEGTVRSDLQRNEMPPISRNTWKDSRLMIPSKAGYYFLTEFPEDNDPVVCWYLKKGEIAAHTYWCGPIVPPKYDPAEIELERKLREVTK